MEIAFRCCYTSGCICISTALFNYLLSSRYSIDKVSEWTRGGKTWVAVWGPSRWIEIRSNSSKNLKSVLKLSKYLQLKLSRFFQMISHFPDGFKASWIFPDDCQFSRWYQAVKIFPDDLPFSGKFRIAQKHWLYIYTWQCRERQTCVFLGFCASGMDIGQVKINNSGSNIALLASGDWWWSMFYKIRVHFI